MPSVFASENSGAANPAPLQRPPPDLFNHRLAGVRPSALRLCVRGSRAMVPALPNRSHCISLGSGRCLLRADVTSNSKSPLGAWAVARALLFTAACPVCTLWQWKPPDTWCATHRSNTRSEAKTSRGSTTASRAFVGALNSQLRWRGSASSPPAWLALVRRASPERWSSSSDDVPTNCARFDSACVGPLAPNRTRFRPSAASPVAAEICPTLFTPAPDRCGTSESPSCSIATRLGRID